MRARDLPFLIVAGALALAVALLVPRVAAPARATLELARERPTRVSPEDAAALRAYPTDVTLTYFVSDDPSLPSEMRGIERDVRAVLEALADASDGRIEVRVVRPEGDPELERFAASRGVAPFRRRSVVRDRFTETTVWSTLEIAAGAHPPAHLRSLGPEHLPHLRALVLAHLACIQDPPRPRVAYAAPTGFERLRTMLEEVCDVVPVALDAGELPPADVDMVVWLEPRDTSARVREALEALREDGASLFIAGSEYRADVGTDADGRPELRLSRRGLDARELWAEWGLAPSGRIVLDDRAQDTEIAGERHALPFVVRCIGQNQDFRGFVDQPAGSIVFPAPTSFVLDGEALAERGFTARVLATSSDRTVTRDLAVGAPGEPIATPLDELARDVPGAQPLAKQALAVMVEPTDPWQGAVIAFGAASAFHDGHFDDAGFEHRRLAQIVALELLSNARLVARRTERHVPERLPPLDARARVALRLAVLLALPGLLLALAFARGEVRLAAAAGRWARRAGFALAGIALFLLAGGGLARLGAALGGEADLTRGSLESLSATTADLGTALERRGGLALTWYGSPLAAMAPEQRAGARRALALFERFADRTGADFRRLDPDALPDDEREALEAAGLVPFRVRSQDEERVTVRAVHATLVVAHGGREERIAFPDALAFEDTEFRLAHALWRLERGRAARVALATDVPRLSPAEAQTDFLSRRRFAPSGTDVYSLARGALERAGFDVVHVEPRHGRVPAGVDALVWLQPRRPIERMMEALALHLHGGGRALLAAQHFVVQPQQHEGRDFRTVYWPEPQVPDVETRWLPELGIELVRRVLFDELSADVPLVTRVGSDPATKEYDVQASALPFLLRASQAHAVDDPVTRGIGDQVLPFGNAWRFDDARVADLGLAIEVLMTTSPRTWSFDWRGGFLPQELLDGPPSAEDGSPRHEGPQTLVARVTGRFPLPLEPLVERDVGDPDPVEPPPAAGELLLVGGSEAFKDARLLDPRFRGDRFLVNAVAHLALPPELAALAGRRAVPPGFGHVEPRERLAWRTAALAGGPLVALLAALARAIARRRRAAREAFA